MHGKICRLERNKFFFGLVNALFAVIYLTVVDFYSPIYAANKKSLPDQNFFQLAGKLWASGGVPYRDLWDQKGPFIFWVNRIGYLLTGDEHGIFYVECVFLLALMFFLWKIIGESSPGLPTYAKTVILWMSFGWLSVLLTASWNMTELYCLPFLAASFWLALKSFHSLDDGERDASIPPVWAGIHGLAVSICVLTRATNALVVCCAVLVLAIALMIRKQWKELLFCALGFLLGFIIPMIPFLIYFACNHALYDFFFGMILFNFSYTSGGKVDYTNVLLPTTVVLVLCVPLLLLVMAFCRSMKASRVTFENAFDCLAAVALICVYCKLFPIQANSCAHYTAIDVVFIPVLANTVFRLLKSKVKTATAISACCALLISGYGLTRTYDVAGWDDFDNKELSEVVSQSNGSIAFYNLPSIAYLENDVMPVYQFAVFQDWQALFSDTMRQMLLADYSRPKSDYLVTVRDTQEDLAIRGLLNDQYVKVKTIHIGNQKGTVYRLK